MERAWAALCTSGASILLHLSSNPVMIFPGDLILTSVSTPTVQEMLQGLDFAPWEKYTLSHNEVVILGKDSAFIYYRVEAARSIEKFHAICSCAWALEQPQNNEVGAGKWQLTSRH